MVCTLCLVNDLALSIWFTVCFIAFSLEQWKLIWRRKQWKISQRKFQGMNLSFLADLGPNSVFQFEEDRHPYCKIRSVKSRPLLLSVGGSRKNMHSHSDFTNLLTHRMWPSFTLLHMRPSSNLRKVLVILISILIACIDLSHCQTCGHFTCIRIYIYF